MTPLIGIASAISLSITLGVGDFLLLPLSFRFIKFFEHLEMFLHIEYLPSPSGNDDGRLLLAYCHRASHVFDYVFVLLLPVTFHFAV